MQDTPLLQSSLLLQFPQLAHGFSRIDPRFEGNGNMSLSTGEKDAVLQSRQRFCDRLSVSPDAIVMADQVHGDKVLVVDESDRGKGATQLLSPLGKADGLCSQTPGLPLTVIVADCAALFLYDPQQRAIGLAHSGWRGTARNMAHSLIRTMKENYSTDPSSLFAWVSPCIGPDSFEVGLDVLDDFRQRQPGLKKRNDWYRPNPENDGKWLLDLKGLLRDQLLDLGLPEDKIDISPDCTFSRREYFSYRQRR